MSHILDMISFLRGDVIANYQMHSLHAGRIGKQTNFLLVLPEERHGSIRSSKRSYLHLLCWKYAGTCRLCDKLAWYSAEDKYYATSQKLPGYVFVLNTGFHEIDCLRPFLGSYTKQIVDQSNLSAQ